MNSVLPTPFIPPHLLPNRTSPNRYLSPPTTTNMSSRKRKPEDDGADLDTRMSASPSSSPSMPNRALPAQAGASSRRIKRPRTNINGRPLALHRLLETLSAEDMRKILGQICDNHPEIGAEVTATAPRPSVQSALDILNKYESTLQDAFPFGGNRTSEYAYNRVRQPLAEVLDALKDYTPHFLPPNELQTTTSLSFLDGVTNVIHRLPEWDSYQHNRHKADAYDEIAKAWALVIREASKRGGGIQLRFGGWDQKLSEHNDKSGGKMAEAMHELHTSLGWIDSSSQNSNPAPGPNDPASIRQQLLSGTYGSPLRVGPW
ncbi:tethering factor for nuclear proteasome STS1 [Tothia fuscella]|uniref:Tethering factor for nuclear proteasome STS1 n=1 Tax=Tothia fuscella TaxID=1048955 RepID=A0A9P4TRV1_9PEZI|nr:tethering factor for nuclear proteasome STS1 [Tothia fuscella]